MMFFRNFNAPIWEIFAGNLLLLFCSLFYLAWWVVTFRPNSSGGPVGVFCIVAAFITGIVAIVLLSGGISSLSQSSESIPVMFILLGAVALLIVLVLVTTMAFHRIVTSELIIILIWAALELSVIAVLYGTGRFGSGSAVTLAVLVGIGTIVSLICYVLYYRLDETASYWVGMVPLTAAGLAVAVILGVLAVS